MFVIQNKWAECTKAKAHMHRGEKTIVTIKLHEHAGQMIADYGYIKCTKHKSHRFAVDIQSFYRDTDQYDEVAELIVSAAKHLKTFGFKNGTSLKFEYPDGNADIVQLGKTMVMRNVGSNLKVQFA